MSDKALRLDVRVPMGVGNEKKESVIERWSTYSHVEGTVTALGLGELHQPQSECPMLTAEMLNETDSNRYADNQQWVSSWLNFSTELLARVEAQMLEYENMLLVLTAETKRSYRELNQVEGAKKVTVDELNQKLVLSPEYQSVKHLLQQHEQKKLLLRARVDTLDSMSRLLSRRIELTKIDINSQRSADGANSRFRGRGQL